MLPRKSTIRKAIEAAEMSLFLTKKNARGYEDTETNIIRRIEALQHVLRTGTPDLDIIKEIPSQQEYIEIWKTQKLSD